MSTPPADSLVSLLDQDHRDIERRFAALADGGPDGRSELFWKLTDELVRHEVAEEVVVYHLVRKEPGGNALAEARLREQGDAEAQLARMEKLDAAGAEFVSSCAELRRAVLDHAQREEQSVWPLLKTAFGSDELIALGARYQEAKRAAPNHPHPHPHAPDGQPANAIVGTLAAFVDRIRDAANGV